MKLAEKIIRSLPYIGKMRRDLDLHANVQYPPGHYSSPVVSKEEVQADADRIFNVTSKEIRGIDLREEQQLQLLAELANMYTGIPFTAEKQEGYRYYYENLAYSYSDAIFLHLMIRYFKPERIIEIGSGFSSTVMLDTNEYFFGNSINLSFIEPYPNRFYSVIKPEDKQQNTIICAKLQSVDVSIFKALGQNDILFVDSTHVSKTGSDVNRILFEILPSLNRGVVIHFHDIFYPFEYPKEWVLDWAGFGWNESYILRAFLTDNPNYTILLFNTFLEYFHKEWFLQHMPLCLTNLGGSLWIKKN
jgi:hypothetical protein